MVHDDVCDQRAICLPDQDFGPLENVVAFLAGLLATLLTGAIVGVVMPG